MSITETSAATVPFERFWRWLIEHPNCIVRAGTYDAVLFDSDEFHWAFVEEEDGRAIVQMLKGKHPVGELILERQEIQSVKASPDVEGGQSGQWLFEVVGGPKNETYAMYHFVMSHGMDPQATHQPLKH
ncbi:MAG: serine/threonine protein kinase [Myxococcaceae bacterium]|nr:serine/threonine protein kinase [Myxococcaceae bacterium]